MTAAAWLMAAGLATAAAAAPTEDAPAPAGAEASAAAGTEPTVAEKAAEEVDEPAAPPAPASIEGPAVIDGVLPCGVRVIVGQDRTLPVAAVVLAVETGSEDDPSDRPGLVRALAYHLLQGNREIAPGGAAALVHDAGGLTTLSVGLAQIRYESLVPVSRLAELIEVEARRLVAPTVTDALWADTLRWARRDPPHKRSTQPEALAAAHRTPALARNPAMDVAGLTSMTPEAVGTALADRFTYSRTTLAVVAPGDPAETWDRVVAAFAGLPDAPRTIVDRTTALPPEDAAPRDVEMDPASGELFVFPVAPTPAALDRATVWCKTLNRQTRAQSDSKRARVRCHLDVDPRRATLVVRASGDEDPLALLRSRLARIADGTDDALVDRQREIVELGERMSLRQPLPLARRLTQAAPPASTQATIRPLDVVTGVDALTADAPVDEGLSASAAIHLVPAGSSATETP